MITFKDVAAAVYLGLSGGFFLLFFLPNAKALSTGLTLDMAPRVFLFGVLAVVFYSLWIRAAEVRRKR